MSPQIQFTPDEDELLDAIWDEIAQEQDEQGAKKVVKRDATKATKRVKKASIVKSQPPPSSQ